MKKFIYFCGLIVLVSLYASCGDSSEYFDEHFVYKTKATRGMDMRNEPGGIYVIENDGHETIEIEFGDIATLIVDFSWPGGSPINSTPLTATRNITLKSNKYWIKTDDEMKRAHFHDDKPRVIYNIEFFEKKYIKEKDTVIVIEHKFNNLEVMGEKIELVLKPYN